METGVRLHGQRGENPSDRDERQQIFGLEHTDRVRDEPSHIQDRRKEGDAQKRQARGPVSQGGPPSDCGNRDKQQVRHEPGADPAPVDRRIVAWPTIVRVRKRAGLTKLNEGLVIHVMGRSDGNGRQPVQPITKPHREGDQPRERNPFSAFPRPLEQGPLGLCGAWAQSPGKLRLTGRSSRDCKTGINALNSGVSRMGSKRRSFRAISRIASPPSSKALRNARMASLDRCN